MSGVISLALKIGLELDRLELELVELLDVAQEGVGVLILPQVFDCEQQRVVD